ncbi:protein kinase, putative [Trypanosoma cruzi]|uniref:Protein kinase, putative n=2 Tax=Trypanosoma cruzi TaxID=5693 RepID=Q4DQU1_TRYCC|nr:protein kinase, putative [Trypanosoma cruzi]EAN94886.1 protein kinase, putative [Trypanosoma cruzi]|eukprot:XP_816737.1 protein kinase [Trypanosoma cruzi strain CL Brener]
MKCIHIYIYIRMPPKLLLLLSLSVVVVFCLDCGFFSLYCHLQTRREKKGTFTCLFTPRYPPHMTTYRKQIVGKYELGKVLASGYFDCRTRLCTHIVTGAQYVVRIYNKSVLAEAQWMWDRTRDAINVMRTLPKHENLIETVECFETQTSLYILMQLFAPLQVTKLYTSETASGHRVMIPIQQTKHYYAQVVRGLLHMHEHNVVHLGLAPDHVMVNDRDQVKIGYLVSCAYFPKGEMCHDIRGTTHTVAPEVLRNEGYDPYLADAWSMGVLLYFMLHHGRYPHDGANTTKNIMYNRIRPPDPTLSPDARDLLARLLHPTPSRRMRVENIMSHPFFAANQSDTDNAEGRGAGRFVVSSPETYCTLDLATGEDTVNIQIPYGLSRQEEAAYIIQHTYRAYRSRKWQQLSQRKSSVAKDPAAPRHNKIGRRPSFMSGVANPLLSEPPEVEDVKGFVSHRTDRRQSRGGAIAAPPDMPRFDDASVGSGSASEIIRDVNDSVAFVLENTVAVPSSAATPALENAVKSKYSPSYSRTHNSTLSSITSPRRGDAGRTKTASFAPRLEHDARTDEKNVENVVSLMSNIKIDATRPCPLCHRLPMQRLAGREPYANTPFVYQKGECIPRVLD